MKIDAVELRVLKMRLLKPFRTSFGVQPTAKAASEMACTAAIAEHARKPLAKFLGGVRDRVETGVSIGIQSTVDELLDNIGASLAQGYRRIKVKIEPGWDVMALGAIR